MIDFIYMFFISISFSIEIDFAGVIYLLYNVKHCWFHIVEVRLEAFSLNCEA